MQSPKETFKISHLSSDLIPVSISHFFYLKILPCSIYIMNEGNPFFLFREGIEVSSLILKELLRKNQSDQFYTTAEDYQKLMISQQENLKLISRSVSIGNPIENGKKLLHLITLNMAYLYRDPTNDNILQIQYLSTKNLFNFLYRNTEIHEALYQSYIKQQHYFIYSQPILASFFLIGILKQSPLINERANEALFFTSFFKDIGMSSISNSIHNKQNLTAREKKMLHEHPMRSVELLTERISLSADQFNIIKQHHSFSANHAEKEKTPIILGFETMIISVTDIIAAMITGRPFHTPISLIDSLFHVKELIAAEYPAEFKLIVSYFKSFFIEAKKLSDKK